MGNRDLGSFLGFSLGLVVLLLLSFGLLQWLHIPSGQLLDWAIGIASFWWLLAIVTLPWNVYFEAKGTLTEAEASRRREIKVDELQIAYVQTVAQRALLIAIALHLLSAAGLYALAATGISAIGYISSVAALLLTGLRPAVSFYQYVAMRLQDVRRTIKYPREDVVALKLRVTELETLAKQIQCHLNLDQRRDESWATQQETAITRLQTNFDQLTVAYKTLQTENQAEHHQLVKESRSAIAQLNEDSQFLEHAREIIRFFKSA
ncbi:MAG: hypothetical protein AAGF66_14470 [Cyanobacteria bacterium P01_H01_bin.119]